LQTLVLATMQPWAAVATMLVLTIREKPRHLKVFKMQPEDQDPALDLRVDSQAALCHLRNAVYWNLIGDRIRINACLLRKQEQLLQLQNRREDLSHGLDVLSRQCAELQARVTRCFGASRQVAKSNSHMSVVPCAGTENEQVRCLQAHLRTQPYPPLQQDTSPDNILMMRPYSSEHTDALLAEVKYSSQRLTDVSNAVDRELEQVGAMSRQTQAMEHVVIHDLILLKTGQCIPLPPFVEHL